MPGRAEWLRGGTPLPRDEFQAILDAHDSALLRLHWRPGDLLLVDNNMLTAHGREPHTGDREVAVAMAH